jgi:quinoprotein glucose dehydrogenase
MSDTGRSAPAPIGFFLLASGALLGLAAALVGHFWRGSGIFHSGGALLVVASSAVLLGAVVALSRLRPMGRGLAIGLRLLVLIDIAATAFAAYLLMSWVLLGAMVLALTGWIVECSRARMRAFAWSSALAVVALTVTAAAALEHAGTDLRQTTPSAARAFPSASATASTGPSVRDPRWYTFNGDLMDQKYSEADQITPQNVARMRKVWETHTGDVSDGSGNVPVTDWSATPLFVNDTVYVGTPFYRIFALEPDTGKVKWRYDTHAPLRAETQPDLKTRGVAYWQAASPQAGKPCQKIVYIGTMDGKLHAVDADSGTRCTDFGSGGVLDVNQWNTVHAKWPLSILQPPTVYQDTLFLGWAGKDWAYAQDPPGTVFAIDARTGNLKWTFHALPPQAIDETGTANVWASMSIDPEHGILYLPVSSPSPNFYGGNIRHALPYATSITALDANTGAVRWSRPIVHHDLWDYDTDSAPTLVDLHEDGRVIPALVQSSKMGFLFVLNRLTGEPIHPLEERPVPVSDVPGEHASPTQPYPTRLPPTVPDRMPGVFGLADWAGLGECSRSLAALRYEGRYTPPSLRGSLAYPSTAGGVEWGGGAVDPRTGVYVVNSSQVAQVYRLLPRDEYEREARKGGTKAEGYFPQLGVPYGFHLRNWFNRWGMPCWGPPYGTISAYDLNTGDLLWRKPFGAVQKWGFYMPESWGSVTIGGPLLTKSGLIFIGGSMDARVRAIDLRSGEVLWKALVEAPAVANPATYIYKGTQYVVFVVGGNAILKPQVSDQVVAYALAAGDR